MRKRKEKVVTEEDLSSPSAIMNKMGLMPTKILRKLGLLEKKTGKSLVNKHVKVKAKKKEERQARKKNRK